mmetsp:Transcript_37378/g.88582  ORF Transcript_37378/g.88582 Transcript_37378/m.88582 type:complete len:453 (+) Transcript_37378:2-1360(+)
MELAEWALDFANKVKTVVVAAVCADLGVHTDSAEKNPAGRMAREATPSSPFTPGRYCTQMARWLRTDAQAHSFRRSDWAAFLFLEAMDALLWGRVHPDAKGGMRSACADLEVVWRSTRAALTRAGWRRQGRGLPVGMPLYPTPREASGLATLRTVAPATQLRVCPLVAVVNWCGWDSEVCGEGLKVSRDTSAVANRAPENTEEYQTMCARCVEPIDSRQPLGLAPGALLFYFEVLVEGTEGDEFGFSLGIVSGESESLDNWYPENSLRLEYDGSVRGKGMFESLPQMKADDARAVLVSDRVAILLDLLTARCAWFINGQQVAAMSELPLAHNMAQDLRVMVSLQRCKVSITPVKDATDNLKIAVPDWDGWLAAGAGGAGVGRRALAAQGAWLPIKGSIVQGDPLDEEDEEDGDVLPVQAAELIVRGPGTGQARAVTVQIDGGEKVESAALWS